MGKGRKSIPTNIIELRGGSRAIHHKAPRVNEPRPPENIPPCPDVLDEKAREEWVRTSEILANIGLLTDLDMVTLAGYCQSYSEWVKATESIRDKTPVWVDMDGIPRLNPWLKVAREAFERMMKNACLIGMSPASRASLRVEPKRKAEEGSIEAFRNRKKKA